MKPHLLLYRSAAARWLLAWLPLAALTGCVVAPVGEVEYEVGTPVVVSGAVSPVYGYGAITSYPSTYYWGPPVLSLGFYYGSSYWRPWPYPVYRPPYRPSFRPPHGHGFRPSPRPPHRPGFRPTRPRPPSAIYPGSRPPHRPATGTRPPTTRPPQPHRPDLRPPTQRPPGASRPGMRPPGSPGTRPGVQPQRPSTGQARPPQGSRPSGMQRVPRGGAVRSPGMQRPSGAFRRPGGGMGSTGRMGGHSPR